MDKQTSIFVDKVAVENLIKEKLSRVVHSPKESLFREIDNVELFLSRFLDNSQVIEAIEASEYSEKCVLDNVKTFDKAIILKSCLTTPYHQNNIIPLCILKTPNNTKAKANILFIHGLFDFNSMIHEYLLKNLTSLGFNIYFMQLPYHYHRKPDESLFSGEFYMSADLPRTQYSLIQSILDIRTSIKYIEETSNLPLNLLGFSLGGLLAFLYHISFNNNRKLFLINPVSSLFKTFSDNILFSSVRKDLDKSGVSFDNVKRMFSYFEIYEKNTKNVDISGISLCYGIYDQIIPTEEYKNFIDFFRIQKKYELPAGHMNILRNPDLPKIIS